MGYHPRRDIVGKRFEHLVVIERLPGSVALCGCDCGRVTKVKVGALPNQKSCGKCWRERRGRKHGMAYSPEYNVWEHMIQRCTNSNDDSYHNYGSRGITVCDRWRESFMAFFSDMGARPGRGYTIERINNDGGYEPGNCRWIPKALQSKNRRANRPLTCAGVTMSMDAWAAKLEISVNTIRTRLHRGWTMAQICSLPAQRGKKPGPEGE